MFFNIENIKGVNRLESNEAKAFVISMKEWLKKDIALIVIDVQNYSTNPKWKLIDNLYNDSETRVKLYDDYYKRLRIEVIPNIIKLVSVFKEKSKKIIFIKYESFFENFDDLSELHKCIWSKLRKNTGMLYKPKGKSFEIVDKIKELISDENIILSKITNGLFASTNLDMILRNLGIRSLVICGAWTNCCVETSVREAFDRGYFVNLAEDACIAPGKSFHNAALLNLGNFYCNICRTGSLILKIRDIY